MPLFVALVLFSGYEILHVKWAEFIYIDDNKNIPTRLHVVSELYHIGFGVGILGLVVMAARFIIVRALTEPR